MQRTKLALAALLTAAALPAMGSGMMIPKDGSVPPLAIKHQRVDIQIKDGAATVKIEQVFQNSVDRDLEAVYVFPLPEGAAVADFAMYMNGKRVSGEIVEKDKARKVYEDIVRRMRDPGLLERLSGNLFRASVYPVPKKGEQRIEIAYAETLQFDGGLYRLVYPLKTGEQASGTLEDFTVNAKLVSSVPIRTVYSPSHKVGISRKGDHEAVIGFEEDKSILDRDFVLYYGVSRKDFGLNLLTYCEKKDEGFFMMLISPSVEPPESNRIEKDVTFVFDTSGSMSGAKIEQARSALRYCVGKLNDGDRFNIVRFSTDVEAFRDGLVKATDAERKAGLAFVEGIEARGGTDINGALVRAVAAKGEEGRPHFVVFLTDGRPTIGSTETEEILKNVDGACAKGVRVFVFGVGNEVNTHLLDRLAGGHGGLSQYVRPDEDIEVHVSSFQDKMSHPVLANPQLKIEKLEVSRMHPARIGDLFAGGQITVFGRYRGDGHVAIRLTGDINGKKQEYVYEATFQERNVENGFVPRLWATRRVGHLLEEIRLHGEEKELKDEVLKLSREYGILTPYTSYLVLESDGDYVTHGLRGTAAADPVKPAETRWAERSVAGGRDDKGAAGVARAAMPVFEAEGMTSPDAYASFGPGLSVAGGARPRLEVADEARRRGYFARESGESAVTQSEAIRKYKMAERVEEEAAPAFRSVGKRFFYLVDGVWVDRGYRKGMTERKVAYASEEYFRLIDEKPELKDCFALGVKVIVCIAGDTAIVVE